MAEENWDNEYEYLMNSRFLGLNDDYFEFLVRNVWKLDEPRVIADFGCDYGFLGTKFLPLLPQGSSYTGIDKSVSLLEKAKHLYSNQLWPHTFIESEVYRVPFEDSSFDLTVSNAMLMHLETPSTK